MPRVRGNLREGSRVKDANAATAHSLLLAFLELRSLSPDLADWTEERMASNPPRLYRLRRLVALFRAFGIPWDPRAFTRGLFIDPEQPRYASTLSRLTTEMPTGSGCWDDGDQLPRYFSILYDYREQVDGVLRYSSGVMAASGLYLQAHSKADELNRVISANVRVIDEVLAALISPEAAVFSVEHLERDFSYPDVDLAEIDLDWW